MRKIRFASAAVLAVAVMLTGCTAAAATSPAATSPAATSPAATSPAATPPAAASQRVLTHVTAYSINTDSHVLTAIVSGAIGDFGPAEIASLATAAAAGEFGQLELKLSRGSFRLDIASIGKKLVQADSHEPIFPRTCSTWVSIAGQAPIVPGSGTGGYQGIAGTFAMTLTLNEVHNRPCATSLSILRQIIVLSATGNITNP